MTIRRDVLDLVLAHARAALPRECCGILLAEGHDRSTVTRALPAENEERACPGRAYLIGHKAHIKAIEMEAEGAARIVGYYHSHPCGAPAPSARDAELADQEAAYLIVGFQDGRCEAAVWRFDGHGLVSEPLKRVE